MILISFCIPTYNRFDELRVSLESFISQGIDLDSIEIVIADNASTDDRYHTLMSAYARFIPNLSYIRHAQNIGADNNFFFVLSRGRGRYLKLWNDTLVLREDALQLMLSAVSFALATNICPLFCNGLPTTRVQINSLEDVADSLKFYITHIQYFGIWLADMPSADVFDSAVELKLPHVSAMLSLVANHSCSFRIVNDICWDKKVPVNGTENYDQYQVFLFNLLSLYKRYGLKSASSTYRTLRDYTVCHLCAPWIIAHLRSFFRSGGATNASFKKLIRIGLYCASRPLLAFKLFLAIIYFLTQYSFRSASMRSPALQGMLSLSGFLLPHG